MRTLNAWLRDLDALNAAPHSSIKQAIVRAEKIAQILERDPVDYGLIKHEIGGSAAKNTATAFMQDVDLYVYVDVESYRRVDSKVYSPKTILSWFEARLKQYYGRWPRIEVRKQRRSVRVRYGTDPQLDIDVVPLLVESTERFPLIGDRGEGWIHTSLDRQASYFDEHNHRQRLARFVRLMKLWRVACKRQRRRRWGSYVIEVLGHWMCKEADAGGSGEVLFRQFIERVARDGLSESVVLRRWRGRYDRPTRGRRQPLFILDPAVPEHDLAGDLERADRDKLEADARATVVAFEEAATAWRAGAARGGHAAMRRIFKPSKVYRGRGLLVPSQG